jgi:hypothetical protein
MLITTIGESLKQINTDVNRKYWAAYIVNNHIDLISIISLIEAEHPVAMRFSWVLGDLCETAPAVVYPSIAYLFNKREQIKIPNFNRSLAKLFYYCGVPNEIEGEAINELFKWLQNTKSNVSTKSYAMLALHQLTQLYPELQHELKAAIESQLNLNTPSFDKQAQRILLQLNRP